MLAASGLFVVLKVFAQDRKRAVVVTWEEQINYQADNLTINLLLISRFVDCIILEEKGFPYE
jgi:hypothetical protein